MMLPLLYESIYAVVTDLYLFVEFFVRWWLYLNLKVVDLYHKYTIGDDYQYISKNLQEVNKIPTHVTVILGNENPSYQDLAKLAMWSAAAGISFISFYDHKGILKKNEEKLQQAISKYKSGDVNVVWYNNKDEHKSSDKKIYVKTLSYSDGRANVAYIARKLCNGSKIDIQAIDSQLKDSFTFPDPELALYCDEIFSICGYPPWQIRVTEFIPLGTHHNIASRRFIKALYAYNKVEQRLGK